MQRESKGFRGRRSASSGVDIGQEVSVKFLIPILLAVICTREFAEE